MIANPLRTCRFLLLYGWLMIGSVWHWHVVLQQGYRSRSLFRKITGVDIEPMAHEKAWCALIVYHRCLPDLVDLNNCIRWKATQCMQCFLCVAPRFCTACSVSRHRFLLAALFGMEIPGSSSPRSLVQPESNSYQWMLIEAVKITGKVIACLSLLVDRHYSYKEFDPFTS
jgi:hypothetical protein